MPRFTPEHPGVTVFGPDFSDDYDERAVVGEIDGDGVRLVAIRTDDNDTAFTPATAFQVALAILQTCTEITGTVYTVTPRKVNPPRKSKGA